MTTAGGRGQDAAASAAALEGGGLPAEALRRLAQETGERPVFATDLSVQEFLLARGLGYDAAGLVMGSSIYHVGWQWISTLSAGELQTVTRAHLHARELALGRMQHEAAVLGAHGVVGVRLTEKEYEWGQGLLEFTAVGTAVRLRGVPPPARPFLCDLSGEDFWALLQSGAAPRGLAMGYCSFISAAMSLSRGRNWYQNWEIEQYTAAVYQARHLAMERIAQDLGRLDGTGLVGTKIDTRFSPYRASDNSRWVQLRVDFLALGTAIVEARRDTSVRRPLPVLNMTGLRPVRPRLAGAELQR